MQITDSEIFELEELLKQEEICSLINGLTHFTNKTSPNYKILYQAINSQKWGFDKNGKPKLLEGFTGCVLEGSSRSTKTWGSLFIIVYLALIKHEKDGCTINIYRETYNEFKTTLYDDFKRILNLFSLDNPFERAKEISNFKIGRTTINLLGDGKFGGGCDYAFFNEVMFINEEIFKQVKMRCRYFWWMDFNPCFTDHWVFNSVIPRSDVCYLKTTFKQNPYISPNELNEILGYEPWKPGSYEVIEDDVLFKGEPVTDKNVPPPHPINVKQGTASEFDWKVYGLGLRGAMTGGVFKHLTWIESFPSIAHTYANDFGFTADPNALVKYAEDEKNIWFELLSYHPIETDEELSDFFEYVGVEKDLPITCDSSDKYTGENKGTIEMVKGLKKRGWKAKKVRKTKSVMYWILSMKKKKIHCVKNKLWKHVKKEKENYKFKEVNGIMINQPIDKWNHVWDSVRYGHISHNTQTKTHLTTKTVAQMGINY